MLCPYQLVLPTLPLLPCRVAGRLHSRHEVRHVLRRAKQRIPDLSLSAFNLHDDSQYENIWELRDFPPCAMDGSKEPVSQTIAPEVESKLGWKVHRPSLVWICRRTSSAKHRARSYSPPLTSVPVRDAASTDRPHCTCLAKTPQVGRNLTTLIGGQRSQVAAFAISRCASVPAFAASARLLPFRHGGPACSDKKGKLAADACGQT